MRRRLGPALATILLLIPTACGSGGDDPEVVVLRGDDLIGSSGQPPSEEPTARLLPGSGGVVFVSAPLYSGSCPPTAEAQRDGSELVLTIGEADESECTDDANPYTFVIGAGETGPERLVVREDDSQEIVLDLRPEPIASE